MEFPVIGSGKGNIQPFTGGLGANIRVEEHLGRVRIALCQGNCQGKGFIVEQPEKVFLTERKRALNDARFAFREGAGGELRNGLADEIHR